MESHPAKFGELVSLALSNRQPFAWRAAWLLGNCMRVNDERIKGHIPTIIKVLPTVIDGQKRDLINVLRKMELPETYEGPAFDICVAIWCKTDKIPSVRYNALRLMVQIAKKHPELSNEVRLLTQGQYIDSLSPGIKNAILKLMK